MAKPIRLRRFAGRRSPTQGMGRKSIFHPWAVRSNGIIEIYLVERIHWGCRTSAVCRNLHPFYLTDQKNNGSSVEYERKNDNVRANWTVLHQKCSPATAKGWPRACAQLRPCGMAGSKSGS